MKNRIFIFSILFCCMVFSCKKIPETPTNSSKIVLGTTTVDTVSWSHFVVTTLVKNTGGNKILNYGHCWGTGPDPNVNSQSHTGLQMRSQGVNSQVRSGD